MEKSFVSQSRARATIVATYQVKKKSKTPEHSVAMFKNVSHTPSSVAVVLCSVSDPAPGSYKNI